MAADIGAVIAVITADGDRLGDSVDVGLAVIGSVLGDRTVDRRRLDCGLVRGDRSAAIHVLRRGDDAGDEHRDVIWVSRGHGRRGFVIRGRSGGDLGAGNAADQERGDQADRQAHKVHNFLMNLGPPAGNISSEAVAEPEKQRPTPLD